MKPNCIDLFITTGKGFPLIEQEVTRKKKEYIIVVKVDDVEKIVWRGDLVPKKVKGLKK